MQENMRAISACIPTDAHGVYIINTFKKQLLTVSLVMATCTPAIVMAEAASDSGAGALFAAARLNLRVTIPRFLYFRVGQSSGTGDQITFAPLDTEIGDSTSIAGTGGDAAGGSGASVAVRGNGGQITITESNDGGVGGLGTGVGNISLSEITVTSSNGALDTPTLSDGGGNTSTPTLSGGNVTSRTADWTYAYDNTTTPESGDYDAEITYTASSL
jgi:hypothetical protein